MMSRKHGNRRLTRRHLVGLGFVAASGLPVRAERLAPEMPAVLAIGGFDACSYFLAADGAPEPGRAAFEYAWNRRTWRFAHAANLAAFRQDPTAYAPRLGGFDPIGVIAGRFVETDPSIFRVLPGSEGARLYLFRNEDRRSAFTADPALVGQAEACWPALRRSTAADPAE